MLKRSSNRKLDLNKLAAEIVNEAAGQTKPKKPEGAKNPAAVALGRLGGLKGGTARAKSLSKKERVLIARKAARARWKSDLS